jgi:hypothetical protein
MTVNEEEPIAVDTGQSQISSLIENKGYLLISLLNFSIRFSSCVPNDQTNDNTHHDPKDQPAKNPQTKLQCREFLPWGTTDAKEGIMFWLRGLIAHLQRLAVVKIVFRLRHIWALLLAATSEKDVFSVSDFALAFETYMSNNRAGPG